MATRRFFVLSTSCLLVLGMACDAEAGKFNKLLDIGSAAPIWSDLAGADGMQHSLADFKDAKALVVVFTCNHCPVAQSYEERLLKLHADFREKGLELVAVSVSNLEEDRLEAMVKHAQDRGFTFAYLHDPTQKIARDYGATNTPQVFVLNAERKIAYMGAIDDAWQDAEAVTKPYLRDAVEALLGGRDVTVGETKPKGCGIEYE